MGESSFLNMKFDDLATEQTKASSKADLPSESNISDTSLSDARSVNQDVDIIDKNTSHSDISRVDMSEPAQQEETKDTKSEETASVFEDNSPEANQEQKSENIYEEIKQTADEMNSSLKLLGSKMTSIETQLTRLAAYDTAVETLKRSLAANQNSENNLYKEVEAYKRGVYFTNIRPFLTFIIEMLCEMKKSKQQYIDEKEVFIAEHSEAIFNEICDLLDFYISAFENQLTVQGVMITSYEPGEKYIAINQHIVKTVATDDKDMNGIVAEVVSDCYMYDKTVLKPAKVNVYKSTNKSVNSSSAEG